VSPWFNSLSTAAEKTFNGQHFSGSGDVEYIELLEIAARMFTPDPQYQNLSMLYQPKWNGMVEGPTWDMWWIQNSYGTTYTWLPFAVEPWATFIQNAQAMWFAVQGDGKRADKNGYVAPDGCLVDAASPTAHYYRQGDGRHDIHDCGMEFTAAGLLMQAELLLISRDEAGIAKYLPHLERCANFIETRRDPKTGLYLGGVACNLLAPSFAGYKKPDGTYDKAFHAGLQVTYIAALDRLIELEKLAGHSESAAGYAKRRDLAKQSLPKLVTDEGYFVNSIDPDGTKHGVFGAAKHGYFESSVNHDAICFRVADDALAKSIFTKIASIPQLRPHGLITPNYPSYDDMYEAPQGLWGFGTWVNGGHWSTCEARMIMAYYRLGQSDDARASMKAILKFAHQFRMDNPLVDFGNAPYQPNPPINITYDAFGIPAALIRGLFEYQYKSDRLILLPHIPKGITQLTQRDPIRFGTKKIYLSTVGSGHVSKVDVNGNVWTDFNASEINLPFEQIADEARVTITLGYDAPNPDHFNGPDLREPLKLASEHPMKQRVSRLASFEKRLLDAGFGDSYEDAHARLARECVEAQVQRDALRAEGKLFPLPQASQVAADQSYVDAANRVFTGLETLLTDYAASNDPRKQQIAALWTGSLPP
jgi:hypothetical protein